MREAPRSPGVSRGRSRALRLHWGTLACALFLAGCVTNGDFGRVRPELVTDGIHDWVGRDAVRAIGGVPSAYRLTDDERALRDLAYQLIAPPYDRDRWDSVLREYGLRRRPLIAPADRAAYWRKLDADYRRSEASGYARIVTDARNDVEQIKPFFAIAGRVLDLDNKRAISLAHVSRLSQAEQDNALARNAENVAVVGWVCRSLHRRASAYRFALERLVIAAPSPAAADADRALNLLAMQTGLHCRPLRGGRIVAKD